MKLYKSKSFTPELTNTQIETGCYNTIFISFEAAIQLFRQEYNLMELKDKPKGYRVTEQGIEIIY